MRFNVLLVVAVVASASFATHALTQATLTKVEAKPGSSYEFTIATGTTGVRLLAVDVDGALLLDRTLPAKPGQRMSVFAVGEGGGK